MEFSETGDPTKHCEISQPIIKIVNLMKLMTHATRWTKKTDRKLPICVLVTHTPKCWKESDRNNCQFVFCSVDITYTAHRGMNWQHYKSTGESNILLLIHTDSGDTAHTNTNIIPNYGTENRDRDG